MLFPIRCFTCNKVIAGKWDLYQKLVDEGEDVHLVLKKLGIKRACCSRMFITHPRDIEDKIFNSSS